MLHPPGSFSAVVSLVAPEDSVDELRCRTLGTFIRTVEEVQQALRAQVAKAGLSVEGLLVLACLGRAQTHEATPSTLADEIGVHRAEVSQVLSRLEISQLITRRRDVLNRRSVQVRLTPMGRQLLDQAMAACADGVLHLARAFDEGSLLELLRVCAKVNQAVGGLKVG